MKQRLVMSGMSPSVAQCPHKPVRLRPKTTSDLQKSLKLAANEKDVENAFRTAMSAIFPGKTRSPFKVDGLLECDDIRSLLEFKHDWDLKQKVQQCSVLIQALFYIKKFEATGKKLPTTVFVGDVNECFCVKTDALVKYLSKPIDWTVAPSAAHSRNADVLQAMVDDQDILPFVFDVHGKSFDFGAVVENVRLLGQGVVHAVKITKDNVVEIFNYWRTNVLTDPALDHSPGLFGNSEAKAITARQSDIFFACLTDRDGTYLHPRKKNCLISRGKEVKVNANQHRSFFAHFSQVLSPSEMDVLVGNKDRIIEEVSRRREGAFFTPTLWVNEAHVMMDEALGANWRDECVVWDCASGTNNLTRDFKFKELYCSTLNQGDVDTVRDMGYNPGSTVFQYDFLNDMGPGGLCDLGPKAPEGLRKALAAGKKIVFLINPPYGTSGEMKQGSKQKTGISASACSSSMKQAGMGSDSQQIYAQFVYRISMLVKGSNASLAAFIPPSMFSSVRLSAVRKMLYSTFRFKSGMMFKASHFADVQSTWGISFSIWVHGTTDATQLKLQMKDVSSEFAVETIGVKTVYEPEEQASSWVREMIGKNTVEAVPLGSATVVKHQRDGALSTSAIAYMVLKGNNIYKNREGVYLLSSYGSDGHGVSVTPMNFDRAIAVFAARRVLEEDWFNWQDEYLVPHAASPAGPLNQAYKQWVNDAVVYSLFNGKSQQSALRGIQYKGKSWDIANQFFFLAHGEMQALADKAGFHELYQDCKAHGAPRHVATLLETLPLSKDAQGVLEAARALVRASMGNRKMWHADHPELHLQAWDAGHAQLKPLYKAMHKEEYAAFVALYKDFEARMRKGVYEFGFLRE